MNILSSILFTTLLTVQLLFSACSGGESAGGAGDAKTESTLEESDPDSIDEDETRESSEFSCELMPSDDPEDKGYVCNNDMGVAYQASNNSLCRMDDFDGMMVSTCMEGGQTSSRSTRICERGGDVMDCPEIDFSCTVNDQSTLNNWILNCSDNVAVSMDVANNEICRINLTDEKGFCLDDENEQNDIPIVWKGYAREVVEVGSDVPVIAPMWRSDSVRIQYQTTSSSVCSVNPETGLLSIEGFGDCDVALTLTVSKNRASKVIEKRVRGRLAQDISWRGYTASAMNMGKTKPRFIGPEYGPRGASYSYTSNTDICTVNAETGEITEIVDSGDCVITMTSSATNYADRKISFTLRVDSSYLLAVNWLAPYGLRYFDLSSDVGLPEPRAIHGTGSLDVTLREYRSITPSICTVDEVTGEVTILLNGSCQIQVTASSPGYIDKTLGATLTVVRLKMPLTWESPISSLGISDSVQPNALEGFPSTMSGLSYTSQTPAKCIVDSNTGRITGTAKGNCRARATVTAPGYRDGVVDINITIADLQRTKWTGYSASEVTFGGTAPTLNEPTGAPDGNSDEVTIAYSSATESVCTADETTGELSLIDAGNCKIRMVSSVAEGSSEVPSRGTYGDKLIDFDIRVVPLNLSRLGWGTLYGSGSFNIESTGLAPDVDNLENVPEGVSVGLDHFESLTLDVCETDENGELTLLRDGTCSLRATVSATGYRDKVISGNIEVDLMDMNLSWDGYNDSDDTITFGDEAPVLETPSLTTATTHGLSYTSGDTTICTVDEEGVLTVLRDGECVITLTASAPGYNTETITSTQTINPGTITGVTWDGYSQNSLEVGGSIRTTVPRGVPGEASIAYTSESAACVVDGESGSIIGRSEGMCRVVLSVVQIGCEKLTLANDVSIGQAQNISWSGYSRNTMVFGEATPTLNPPTSVNNANLSYASLTENVCTVNARTGELTILDQGSCTIRLTSLKDGYGIKMISFGLDIALGVISGFAWSGYDAGVVRFPDAPNLYEPTGVPSYGTLTYVSQTEDVCKVDESSGELTVIDDGICNIKATVEATGYTSVSVSASVRITPLTTSDFSWTGYSSGSIALRAVPPRLNAPYGRFSRDEFSLCFNLDECLCGQPGNRRSYFVGIGDLYDYGGGFYSRL